MPARKKPQGAELQKFLEKYHTSNHWEKLTLCQEYDATYSTIKNWANQEAKPLPPKPVRMKSASWEEHLQTLKAMDLLTSFHQKVPLEITLSIDTDKPIALSFTADWHIGQFGVDYDSFERDVNLIEQEDGLFCYIGGDGYQNVIQPQKIGAGHNQIPVVVQRGLFVQTLQKLQEKIIAIGTGNHNYWTQLADGEDWDMELARRLHLVYTKHGGLIYLRVGEMVYCIFRIHRGRFGSSFNLTHACKQYQRLYCPDARIVVVEHGHIAAMEQYRYAENECLAIRTGTYAVYDDYAQQNGFWGAHVCNPLVVMFPDKDKLVGFKDMDDGATYLRAVRKEYEDNKVSKHRQTNPKVV